MTASERLQAEPLPHNKEENARVHWPTTPTGRSTDPDRAALEANKAFFDVALLFERAELLLRTLLAELEGCVYPIGVWFVRGSCHGKHTNYVGVDVAREFPGAIGIQVFMAATELIGDDAVLALRAKHEWQWGTRYYPRARSDRHRVHTNFLVPSLDYWERHQDDFIKLAADINAAVQRR